MSVGKLILQLLLLLIQNCYYISGRPNPHPEYYCAESSDYEDVKLPLPQQVVAKCGQYSEWNWDAKPSVNYTSRFNRLTSSYGIVDFGVEWDSIPGAIGYDVCFNVLHKSKFTNVYVKQSNCISVDENQTSMLNYRVLTVYPSTSSITNVVVVAQKGNNNFECYNGSKVGLSKFQQKLDCNCSNIISNDRNNNGEDDDNMSLSGNGYLITELEASPTGDINILDATVKNIDANITWNATLSSSNRDSLMMRICQRSYKSEGYDSLVPFDEACWDVKARNERFHVSNQITNGTTLVEIYARVVTCKKSLEDLDKEKVLLYGHTLTMKQQVAMPFGYHLTYYQNICFAFDDDLYLIYSQCDSPNVVKVKHPPFANNNYEVVGGGEADGRCVGLKIGENGKKNYGAVLCPDDYYDSDFWSRYRKSELGKYEIISYSGHCLIAALSKPNVVWGSRPIAKECSDLVSELDEQLSM